MPLRILEGRAGTGKTTFCLSEMKEKPAVLIVPEQYSFRMGKILLQDAPVTGFDGAQVYSFRRLASLLEGEVAGRTRAILSGSEKMLLISNIIRTNKDKLQVVSPRMSSAGEMAEMIAEFKKYQIRIEDIKAVYDEMEDGLLRRKLADALLLYEAYENLPKMDGEDRFDALAKNIPQSEFIRTHAVYIDQFTGFSPQETEIIKALLLTAPAVTVVLTMAEGIEPQFEMVRKTRKDLASLASRLGEPVEVKRFTENHKHKDAPALSALEQEYFHYPHTPFDQKPEEIELFEASSVRSEITHVASAITRLLREKNYRYSDMVIVGRSMEDYELDLSAELERFDIPYFLDRKIPLLRHRACVAILTAFDILCYGWKYEHMFRYLKCGYTPLSMDEIDRLENYCLAAGVQGNVWKREEAWDMPYGAYHADDYADGSEQAACEADAWRRTVAAPLARLEERIAGKHTLKEDGQALLDFLTDIPLAQKLKEEAQRGGREGMEDAQIYQALLSVLRTLCRTLGEETVTPEEFRDLLAVGLSQSAIGSIPHSLDHVQVSDITRAKGTDAKVVFLIGVCDGVFPKQGAPQGFLSDANRATLEQCGLTLAEDSRGRAYMEQNLIYAALTSASEHLYVSYSVTDGQGESMRPSRIIHRLRQIFPNLEEKSDLLGMLPEDRITTDKGTFESMLTALRLEKEGIKKAPAEYQAAKAWYAEQDEWKEKMSQAERMERESVTPQNLSPEDAAKLYGRHLYTSISRLETYRACPFQFFAKYGLSLKERKKSGMNQMDAGSYLHKVLEDFSYRMAVNGISWRSLSNEDLNRILDDVLPDLMKDTNRYLLQESPRTAFLFRKLRRTAELSLGVVRSHIQKGRFEPMGYEITFEKDGDLAPITIPLANGSCTLRGKIDRADKLETPEGTFYRVIDYKSGAQTFRLSDIYHGLSLQLAVYLDTICENQRNKGEPAHPAGMMYFHIAEPVVDGTPQTSEESASEAVEKKMKFDGLVLGEESIVSAMDTQMEGWSSVLPIQQKKDGTYSEKYGHLASVEQMALLAEHVRRTVKELSEEILSGRVETVPYRIEKKKSGCDYCQYQAMCGFDDKIDKCRYDEINDMSDKEVWQRLEEER